MKKECKHTESDFDSLCVEFFRSEKQCSACEEKLGSAILSENSLCFRIARKKLNRSDETPAVLSVLWVAISQVRDRSRCENQTVVPEGKEAAFVVGVLKKLILRTNDKHKILRAREKHDSMQSSFHQEGDFKLKHFDGTLKGPDNPVANAAKLELEEQLSDCILRLSSPEQSLVIERYWHDLTYEEIARILEKSRDTVRRMLQKVVLKLASCVDHKASNSTKKEVN